MYGKDVASLSWCANRILAWLVEEAWAISDSAELSQGFADHLKSLGLPIYRLRITIRTLHPIVVGTSYTWLRDQEAIDVRSVPYSLLETEKYLNSPVSAIFDDGVSAIRRRLDVPQPMLDYPILQELFDEGATDYVALPLHFSDGQVNLITLAADRPGGFSTQELGHLYEALPVLGRLFEAQAMRGTARTLLETYLGRHTGDRVLDGLVKRGDGETIRAIIWYCDMRESTRLAESMPIDAFMTLLNGFFECMAGAVLDHGGEVLKFIGDAVLAVFPIEAPQSGNGRPPQDAFATAMAAARDAMTRVDHLNQLRQESGDGPISFGLALHPGEVMYGNIGVPERLDFTVIGATINEAARLEGLCKEFNRRLLASSDFVESHPGNWQSLGKHCLRGVRTPQEVFAWVGDPSGSEVSRSHQAVESPVHP